MNISVILSAYNGSSFLKEQLDSIVKQSRVPDELIVIDDASTDDGKTERILREYEKQYSFVRKYSNPENYGWAKSFIHGAGMANGDIIMFADQDDIWLEDKIRNTVAYFDNPKVSAVICSCVNTDENLNPLKQQKQIGNVQNGKYLFDTHFIYPKGVGAAMAIRKSIVDDYLKYWNPAFGHDRFLQVISVMFYDLYYLDKPLLLHRMHGNNATGHRSFDLNKRIEYLEGNIKLIEQLSQLPRYEMIGDKRKKIIKGYLKYAEKRKEMLRSRSVTKWMLMPIYKLSYYQTYRTWIGDYKSIMKKE